MSYLSVTELVGTLREFSSVEQQFTRMNFVGGLVNNLLPETILSVLAEAAIEKLYVALVSANLGCN